MLIRLLQTKSYWLAPLLFWFFIVGASLLWNLHRLDQVVRDIVMERGHPIDTAQAETRQMMLLMHGGGFVLLSFSSIFFMGQLRGHWRQLTETRDQLKQKEAFLTSVTDHMGEGFLVLDTEGKISYGNPESEWLLGWGAAEMAGRNWIELLSPKRGEGEEEDQNTILQTLVDGMNRRVEDGWFVHKDGRRIPVSYTVSAMSKGELRRGVVITFNDTSERKRAEEERCRLERQLNQMHKMEAVGQLAGGIAHEINTPIQYIGDNLRFLRYVVDDIVRLLDAHVELLRQAERLAALKPQVEQIREVFDEIDFDYLREEMPKTIQQSLDGAEQVARIVLAMKEFAHPGSKRMALVDLNGIISNAVEVCKNEWKYVADMDLRLDLDLPQVECLGGELSQVVLNLVINAAHAIAEAKRATKGMITISSEVIDDQVEIRVSDNGTGIAESVREFIFNPFFTTKGVGRGTGQGLAVSKDIVVLRHQGKLWFETEMGEGSTFIVRMPLRQSVINPARCEK